MIRSIDDRDHWTGEMARQRRKRRSADTPKERESE